MALPRALVIGGSIGGLFAAHLLRNAGWEVIVFERTTGDLGDRGTGIGTRDDLFAVMGRVGIAADMSIGVRVEGRTSLARDGSTLHEESITAVTSAWSRIWRPLRRALPDHCYRPGRALVRIDQSRHQVTATFDDHSREQGELLVAADGLHSTVRTQLFSNLHPQYAGYVAWRAAIEPARLEPAFHDLMFRRMVFGFPDRELMLSIPMPAVDRDGGRTCHFVWFRPVSEAALPDLCTDARGQRHGLSIPPPLIRPELLEELRHAAGQSLPPQLAALIPAARQIMVQPIFDLVAPRLGFGRVALIGDAASVARPHVASGVMKAAVDAESLAEALVQSHDVRAALDRYNAARQGYGAAMVERGRHIGSHVCGADAGRPSRAAIVMREYGAAGVVNGQPITARLPA